jgi:hypothetical protein
MRAEVGNVMDLIRSVIHLQSMMAEGGNVVDLVRSVIDLQSVRAEGYNVVAGAYARRLHYSRGGFQFNEGWKRT